MTGFNINHVVLSGNLTRDAELRTTPSGTDVLSFRLANNTRFKNQSTGEWDDKPNYFDVTVWGAMGAALAERLSKGTRVVVSGRIEWREFEDREGNKRQAYDVIADSVVDPDVSSGGSGRSSGGGEVPADMTGLPETPASAPPVAAPAPSSGGGPDDDIPF